MQNPLGMAQNAPKLQRGFPARCQSSTPNTNTFNLTVKLDFSTLPLQLWGRRSIPCHSLSCKSGGNWHLRCSLSKWENTRVHSELWCLPSTLSAELSISENRIKFAHFPFCIFSFSGLWCAHSTRQGGLWPMFERKNEFTADSLLAAQWEDRYRGLFWALPVLIFVCEFAC